MMQPERTYEEWLKIAKACGWDVPRNEVHPEYEHAWIKYWQDCIDHDDDPTIGRPVVPHRSGSPTLNNFKG